MIGPLAKWAIKQAVSVTAKAIQTDLAKSEKAYREAETKKEEAREAADPAYRAHKKALREKARIAAEEERIERETRIRKQDRRELVRKFLWWLSVAMYVVCVLYRLDYPELDVYHRFVVNILASIWMFIVLMFAVSDQMVLGGESYSGGLGCGVVLLIPLCWLGYIFLDIK